MIPTLLKYQYLLLHLINGMEKKNNRELCKLLRFKRENQLYRHKPESD